MAENKQVEISEDFIPENALNDSKDTGNKPSSNKGKDTNEFNAEEIKDKVEELAKAQDVIADDYSQDGFEASMGVQTHDELTPR